MSSDIFRNVKESLQPRLAQVVSDLLPGGRISGREYLCGSLDGGPGDSCSTNLENGIGSDFATGESWGDIISLAAKVWNLGQRGAAEMLAERYGLQSVPASSTRRSKPLFNPILPVPPHAPRIPERHFQHGTPSQIWRYTDREGNTLAYTVRFDLENGKIVLPLCYGSQGYEEPRWHWKALPEPRPLYGLETLGEKPDAPVLLVEGEKTSDAAYALFPQLASLTWSGGAQAVRKADAQPLHGRDVVIWPDNDSAGFKAALEWSERLTGKAKSVRIVLPPKSLPPKWDLADAAPMDLDLARCLTQALTPEQFQEVLNPASSVSEVSEAETPPEADIDLRTWPTFSMEACPGLLGEFVRLATRDSEADPAAVCVTALVRFCAEVYGLSPHRGPHIYVGETVHPPRLFSVICGNSSKARKGTSRHPVTTFFGRYYCYHAELEQWELPLPARESGGPLSTGEGLAYFVRDETDEERERRIQRKPEEADRGKDDKRLIILDEEFASGLACTKREGNTLSMGIRSFWDSGEYAPLTKNNPITVKGAHINILTHITMQELSICLNDVQAFNGFGNRFLWICARRSKLVPLPSRMPEDELAPLQRELWKLIAIAQKRGLMTFDSDARELWKSIYSELSQEHSGLAGSIINRAEAQTLRLALVYSLLDGQETISTAHLQSALAMWRYAQSSALYIFGNKAADPLEKKIFEALKNGPLTATELSKNFNGHLSKERLQPVLQQLEAQLKIVVNKQKTEGRPKLIISLCANYEG